MNRKKLLVLIARQIAMHDGLNWVKISEEKRGQYVTLATDILATVERLTGDGRPIIN
jgi:hypothetical protein